MMSLGPVYGEAAGKYHDVIPDLSFVIGPPCSSTQLPPSFIAHPGQITGSPLAPISPLRHAICNACKVVLVCS